MLDADVGLPPMRTVGACTYRVISGFRLSVLESSKQEMACLRSWRHDLEMPAQFCYGLRDGPLVHVRDLNPAVDRRRRCRCICRDCEQPLQAHVGEEKAWHFQHDVEDRNCNPQPMSLLHAFVHDQLALRRGVVAARRHDHGAGAGTGQNMDRTGVHSRSDLQM